MTMKKNYKILVNFIKDMSIETPDVDSYLYVRDNISNYSLNIDIKSKLLKPKIIQIETSLKYADKSDNKKKSFFELIFATIIRLDEELKDTKDIAKIVLVDVQNEIYPELEKNFISAINNAGFPELRFNKKVDFENLYKKNRN